MRQLLRVSCPECDAGLRIPELADDEVVTCPKCGADFAPDQKPKGRPKSIQDDEDGKEDKAPRQSKNGKKKREETGSSQAVLIACIIVVAILASGAAIAVPLFMKKGGDAQVAETNLPAPQPAPTVPTGQPKGKAAPANDAAGQPAKSVAVPGKGTPATNPNQSAAKNPVAGRKLPGAGDGDPTKRNPGADVGDAGQPARPGFNAKGRPGGPNQPAQPPRPLADLKVGRELIVGSWESSALNPASRKIVKITSDFNADKTFGGSTEETGGKKVEMAGTWDIVANGENFVVAVVASALKDGKPTAVKANNLFVVRFEGKDTMQVLPAPPAAPVQQVFTRKK